MTRKDETRPDIVIIDDVEVCPHSNIVTRTIEATCGCETTAEFCFDCNKRLTEPKTDC